MRRCRAGDIALLAPTGTNLGIYERALEQREISIASQAGKSFYTRQEVQDMIAVARALADRRDTLALGALLRGPLVGLTEEELADAIIALPPIGENHSPHLHLWTDCQVITNSVLKRALEVLQNLARKARQTTPYHLMAEAIEELNVRPILRARYRQSAERALANVEMVLEMARVYDTRGLVAFADALRANWDDTQKHTEGQPATLGDGEPEIIEPPAEERRKFYFDGGQVEIAAHLVYELDPNGKQLRVVRYTDYAAEAVRTLCPTAPALREQWADPTKRSEIIQGLTERGVSFDELADVAQQPDADPFDLLCHLAFNAPLRTRRERAQQLKADKPGFFALYSPEARAVLEELLEKYAEHGDAQFVLPDVLRVPPISNHGQVAEIVHLFGGVDQLRSAVTELQNGLYAA
jgi:EcoEI R protein C-terminal